MKSIDVAKALELSFAARDASTLRTESRIEKHPHGNNVVFLVLKLPASREILVSKAFASFNYFREGIDWLDRTGHPTPAMREFFEKGPLFQEGADHSSTKRRFKELLDQQIKQLDNIITDIAPALEKRARYINNALDFSSLFMRFCVGCVISNLTSAPLSASLRILHRRANIFFFHFHPLRHRRADAALMALLQAAPHRTFSSDEDEAALLVAQSLLVMGYDPLVGALCAALIDKERERFTDAPKRYCPTSFVSRICVADTVIDDFRFTPGDICYVSLVPAEARTQVPTFPFGAGVHTCVGKQFSIAVLERAEHVARRCFPQGFEQTPKAYGDGAFLAFKRP